MKRVFAFIIAVGMMLTASVPAFCADSKTPYNWYCRHTKNGEVPVCDGEMAFIERYGGYYVDKNIADGQKVIYLTFDAGYENGNIGKVLDVMKEKNVRGSFFVLSNLVTRNTDLVKRMADEGHLICNHTAHHKDMTTVGKEEFEKEIRSLETVLFEKCGVECARFYRPPEGRFNEESLSWVSEMGYKTAFWSFAYADWDNAKQPEPMAAKSKILSATHTGEIILLHPTSATNAAILGDLIDAWRSDGYEFATLDALD